MLIFGGCKTLGINLTWLCDHLRSLEKGISWPEFLGVSGAILPHLHAASLRHWNQDPLHSPTMTLWNVTFQWGFGCAHCCPVKPKYPIITNWMVCPLCVWKMSCLFVNTLQQTNIAAGNLQFSNQRYICKHVWFSMTRISLWKGRSACYVMLC